MDVEHLNEHIDKLSNDMTYVRAQVDFIKEGVSKINGRVSATEKEISSLRTRIAFWAGGLSVLTFAVGIVAHLLR